jgi:dihydroorotase
MNYLIKNAIILHETSPHHNKKVDILVKHGIIEKIGKKIEDDGHNTVINGKALHICIGLCDIGTHSGEPGHEHRETMHSLTSSALKGGYTTLAIFPNNKPVTQTKSDIYHLTNHENRNGVKIHAIGALSIDLKGVDIAEYIDMAAAGVVGYSDGLKPIAHSGLLSRALQYVKQIEGLIIHHPLDKSLANGGEMHEGITSTTLGMKGCPSIAEISFVQRDILVWGYTGGRLLEHCISTDGACQLIKTAIKNQEGLSASCAYMNLIHTDEDMVDYDSNLKVEPVLRGKSDRKALIKALKDGTISAIVSNHTPLDEEVKNLEFSYAEPGAIGLETCFPMMLHHLTNEIELMTLVRSVTTGPRSILGLSIPDIKVGEKADLCVFDTEGTTEISIATKSSLSKNCPYFDKKWKGSVVATIV